MSKKELPKKVLFILLPKIGKAPFKGRVYTAQIHETIEGGRQTKAEETVSLAPDGFGVYSWNDDSPFHEQNLDAMERFRDKKNRGPEKFILGPFNCRKEAYKEMDKQRVKTPTEDVTALAAENDVQTKTIIELKAALAKAKSAK